MMIDGLNQEDFAKFIKDREDETLELYKKHTRIERIELIRRLFCVEKCGEERKELRESLHDYYVSLRDNLNADNNKDASRMMDIISFIRRVEFQAMVNTYACIELLKLIDELNNESDSK